MATMSLTKPKEVGTVLCTICEKGICTAADLVIKDDKVMHSRCGDAKRIAI